MKLKDCPFCGGTAEMYCNRSYREISNGFMGTGVAIYCTSCNAEMMLCREDLPECDTDELMEMISDNWNKRK